MTPAQIAARLSQEFGPAILQALPDDKHPRVHVAAETWRELAEVLFHNHDLRFDWLGCITGIDYPTDNKLCAAYDLYSTVHRHWFAVKVYVDRREPRIASVMDLWPAADWHEREAFDLFGIIFEGHRDLRRILLPEDWEGYPLRKDYIFPREYHGIPGTYETDWKQQPDYPK